MNTWSYKSYWFPPFFFDEQTSQLLVISLFLAAIYLRAVAAERDADLTRIIFSLNSTFSDPIQFGPISV